MNASIRSFQEAVDSGGNLANHRSAYPQVRKGSFSEHTPHSEPYDESSSCIGISARRPSFALPWKLWKVAIPDIFLLRFLGSSSRKEPFPLPSFGWFDKCSVQQSIAQRPWEIHFQVGATLSSMLQWRWEAFSFLCRMRRQNMKTLPLSPMSKWRHSRSCKKTKARALVFQLPSHYLV